MGVRRHTRVQHSQRISVVDGVCSSSASTILCSTIPTSGRAMGSLYSAANTWSHGSLNTTHKTLVSSRGCGRETLDFLNGPVSDLCTWNWHVWVEDGAGRLYDELPADLICRMCDIWGVHVNEQRRSCSGQQEGGCTWALGAVSREWASEIGLQYVPVAPRVQAEMLELAECLYGDMLRNAGLCAPRGAAGSGAAA